MSTLVHPNQTRYVLGRNITDNIIIAQEVLNRFAYASGKKGYMAWKIYLSKAYDRLNWSFIATVLLDVGIDGSLHRLLMHCITTVRYRAIVYGETSLITPYSGLRQGDPLYPYIFVLCLDKLSRRIDHMVQAKLWKLVCAARSGPPISHMFFADDLILFVEASPNQMLLIKSALHEFCD